MHHAWGDVPSGACLQPVGLGDVGDLVVALGEVQQALADLVLGCARLEAEEGVREVAAVVVDLGREVVSLRLPQLAHRLRVFVAVVDVMRKRALVVEELGVHWPATVGVPNAVADELTLKLVDGIPEEQSLGRDRWS